MTGIHIVRHRPLFVSTFDQHLRNTRYRPNNLPRCRPPQFQRLRLHRRLCQSINPKPQNYLSRGHSSLLISHRQVLPVPRLLSCLDCCPSVLTVHTMSVFVRPHITYAQVLKTPAGHYPELEPNWSGFHLWQESASLYEWSVCKSRLGGTAGKLDGRRV